MRLRSTRRDERGQGSLETVGVVVLAAILVTSTVGVVTQASPTVRDEVSYRICQITSLVGGGDCQEPDELRTAEDRVPDEPCVVNSRGGEVEVTGSFVVSVSAGKSLLIEEMSDGTFKVTEVESGGVGWEPGVGVDVSVTVDGKKYGAVAAADASVMLEGRMGRTWYADDESGVEDIMEGLLADEIMDAVGPELPGPADVPLINKIPKLGDIEGPPNPVRVALEQFMDGVPDPDEEFVEGGLEGSASASASQIVIGAGGEVEVSGYLGGKSTPDGFVAYYKQSASADVWGAVMGRDAAALAGGETLYEVIMDADGKPTSVKMTVGTTLYADAQGEVTNTDDQTYTETTMEVPLTGDPLQDAQILAAAGGNPLAMLNFVEEAKDSGTVTRNSYSQDPDEYGLDLTGKPLFGEFGAEVDVNFQSRAIESSEYWDGSAMVARPDCAA